MMARERENLVKKKQSFITQIDHTMNDSLLARSDLTKQLEASLIKLLETQRQAEVSTKILEALPFEGDLVGTFKRKMEAAPEFKQDIKRMKGFVDFKQTLWELGQNGDAPEDEDAELQMTGGDFNTLCPITKTEITEPLKNPTCRHTYSKVGIMGIMRNKTRIKCPVPACGQEVHKKDLVEDREWLQKYRIHKIRQQSMPSQAEVAYTQVD